jgi:hypothetical protein
MMTKPTLHLVCNAHLDPAWQWDWQSGAAEALSTFRTRSSGSGPMPPWIGASGWSLPRAWSRE